MKSTVDDEAKALYEELTADDEKSTLWTDLPAARRYAWHRLVDRFQEKPHWFIGSALRYRLGRKALDGVNRGQWLRPWLLLRMASMVWDKDDLPF